MPFDEKALFSPIAGVIRKIINLPVPLQECASSRFIRKNILPEDYLTQSESHLGAFLALLFRAK
jgi:hypothetical protein